MLRDENLSRAILMRCAKWYEMNLHCAFHRSLGSRPSNRHTVSWKVDTGPHVQLTSQLSKKGVAVVLHLLLLLLLLLLFLLLLLLLPFSFSSFLLLLFLVCLFYIHPFPPFLLPLVFFFSYFYFFSSLCPSSQSSFSLVLLFLLLFCVVFVSIFVLLSPFLSLKKPWHEVFWRVHASPISSCLDTMIWRPLMLCVILMKSMIRITNKTKPT